MNVIMQRDYKDNRCGETLITNKVLEIFMGALCAGNENII